MNGWADAEPAWWLNLQARPDTIIELPDGPRAVRARAAHGEERDRLWARWGEFSDQYDALGREVRGRPRSSSSSPECPAENNGRTIERRYGLPPPGTAPDPQEARCRSPASLGGSTVA